MIRKTESEIINGIPTGLLTGLVEGYDFTFDEKTKTKGVVYSDGKGNKVFFEDSQITWLDSDKTQFSIKSPFNIRDKSFEITNTSIISR